MKAALFAATVAAADESFIQCWSNSDCPNDATTMGGMFNGTCCGRTDFVKGDPYLLGADWAATADAQNADPTSGMCNAAATLDFGNIPTGGNQGDFVNIAAYLKHNWDNEEWARPYFVQTMGSIPLESAPTDFDQWVSLVQKDYEPARYWYESEFQTNCLEPRMAPVAEAAQKHEGMTTCKSMDDCQGGMYEGGCCMRSEVKWGQEFFDRQPDEIKAGWHGLQGDDSIGYCAPKIYVDYFESRDGESNFWDYEEFLFN
jgi:hypothetical protein